MTSIILFLNLIGIILILFVSNDGMLSLLYQRLVRQLGLITTVLVMYVLVYYGYIYNMQEIGYQFQEEIFSIRWGVDLISYILICLTSILVPLAILSNWKNLTTEVNKFVLIMVLLGVLLILNFICLDMISFYIFFESTLAPLFILIGMYGAGDKSKAASYILLYTLLSSLFMLLSIGVLSYLLNSTDYNLVGSYLISIDIQCVVWLGLVIAIAVKTPIMPFHTWLPVVHSESPLGGSILLAGVVLKLAIYAVIRLILPGLTEATVLYIPGVYVVGVLTIVLTCLITLRQTDLKVIIAYSSIGHMAVCVLGVFANNLLGLEGSIMMCLAHGFVSPALFIAVGGVLYDRYHNRLVNYYQGLTSFMPVFVVYLVIFSFCNIGTPLSANFLGEILSLAGAYQQAPLLIVLGVSSVLLSACYQMRLTNRLTGGAKSVYLHVTRDLTHREVFLFNMLLIPTIFIGIYPNFILNPIEIVSDLIIYNI